MGLGIAPVRLNLELWQRGLFKNIKSVMEMGSQDLYLSLADFEEIVQQACVPKYKRENFANLANWPGGPRCSAKAFYEMLGVEKYSCIDLGGLHDAIRFDLNLPFEDASLYGQHDLVTDYGTNEHVFNTSEAFRTMHKLCKQHGLMLIVQVYYRGNGYYTYDSSFFEGLAAANNYKIIFSSYLLASRPKTNNGSAPEFLVPLSDELLDLLDWTKVQEIGICYLMQKQSDADFRCPYQDRYLAEKQGHYGYRLQFLPGPPPGRTYLPMYSLEDIRAKSLLQVFIRKAVRRIKLRMKR